ncbi:AsmA-like C-terminal region-containing protein [Candidatus Pelagibacter sp.]|nr:AsmA-like C-terminal region-containing protein [Candidatus Pelagibacter sp.]
MRKYLFIIPIAIIFLFASIITYLNFFGIKTDKLNKLIYSKISQINPKLSSEINDVFIKLDIKEQTIKLETSNVKLQIAEEYLYLDKIISKLSISSLFNNRSIQSLEILLREDEISNFKSFISEYEYNFSRELILSQIKKGKIKASIVLDFQNNNKTFDYSILGKVTNAQINLLNKGELEKISFNFISDQKQHFINDLQFIYEDINFNSETISVKKHDNSFIINGDISNKKQVFDIKKLQRNLDYNFDFIENSKVNLSSNNKFSFSLINKKKIDKFELKSKINFDEIKFKKNLNLPININNGELKLDYKNHIFDINVNSKIYFLSDEKKQPNLGDAKFLISKKKNENIKFKGNFSNRGNKINSDQIKEIINIDNKLIASQDLQFDSNNSIEFELNKKNTIEKYKLNSNLKISKLEISHNGSNLKKFLPEYKDIIIFKDNLIEININKKIKDIKLKGLYSLNNNLSDSYKIDLIQNSETLDFDANINLNNLFLNFKSLDYKKNKKIDSNLIIKGRYKDDLKFNQIEYKENLNTIQAGNITLSKKYKIKNIDSVILNYENLNQKLNNIKFQKKNDNRYKLSGSEFDAQLLISNYLKGENTNNIFERFENINGNISVELNNIFIDQNSKLTNLVGEILLKKNDVISAEIRSKINNKNDFSLYIKTNSRDEKVTNLFIEEPEPFIKNYKFIKGFTEGKLSYGSIEKNNETKANLKIFDFKVQDVPVLAKLLTLASLQGIADILTGEGIRFNEFEMNYESNQTLTNINEMYAIGPAISILMEGYINRNKLTSLRGTLVPATTINKTISKIPLLGDILVGKKVGEGVFGVSFKIKGPPKDLKTSVNPIKTLTPRFITRTLEKLKKN